MRRQRPGEIELVKVEGIYIPKQLAEQAEHERRMGAAIDPSGRGMAQAINRAARRREERAAKKAAKRGHVADPIRVPGPIGKRNAIAKVAEQLVQAGITDGTVRTLAQFLGRYEGKILEESWRRGRPLDKETIRRALAEIHRQGEAARGRR